jgi:hypothetical protein
MAPTSPTARARRLAAQLVASHSTRSAAVPREFDVPPGAAKLVAPQKDADYYLAGDW